MENICIQSVLQNIPKSHTYITLAKVKVAHMNNICVKYLTIKVRIKSNFLKKNLLKYQLIYYLFMYVYTVY